MRATLAAGRRFGPPRATRAPARAQRIVASGKVTPVIDRTYHLAEAAEALRYLGGGHAKGKLVIAI